MPIKPVREEDIEELRQSIFKQVAYCNLRGGPLQLKMFEMLCLCTGYLKAYVKNGLDKKTASRIERGFEEVRKDIEKESMKLMNKNVAGWAKEMKEARKLVKVLEKAVAEKGAE